MYITSCRLPLKLNVTAGRVLIHIEVRFYYLKKGNINAIQLLSEIVFTYVVIYFYIGLILFHVWSESLTT